MWEVRGGDQWDGENCVVQYSSTSLLPCCTFIPLFLPSLPSPLSLPPLSLPSLSLPPLSLPPLSLPPLSLPPLSLPSPSLPSPSLLFLPLGSNRQSTLSLNSGSQEFDTASLRDDMISVTSESPKRCIVLYSYKVSAVLQHNFLHSELYLFNACIH